MAFLAIAMISDLRAQEITVFPGFWSEQFYQDNTRVTRGEVQALMMNNEATATLWKKYRKHETIALISAGVQTGFLLWLLNSNQDNYLVPAIGALAMTGVSIGYSFSAMSRKKKAILEYNEMLEKDEVFLGTTANGVGLVYSF